MVTLRIVVALAVFGLVKAKATPDFGNCLLPAGYGDYFKQCLPPCDVPALPAIPNLCNFPCPADLPVFPDLNSCSIFETLQSCSPFQPPLPRQEIPPCNIPPCNIPPCNIPPCNIPPIAFDCSFNCQTDC